MALSREDLIEIRTLLSIRSSKNAFFAFYEVFWGRKIFWTPESCFSAIFTPRNDVFEKNFSKNLPKKGKKPVFLGHPVVVKLSLITGVITLSHRVITLSH